MHSSLKPLASNEKSGEEVMFIKSNYLFEVGNDEFRPLLKTSIELSRSNAISWIDKLTKISHRNLINLKKIGKRKKNSESSNDQYWLYYQHVPYSFHHHKHQIPTSKLKDSLHSLLQYLQTKGIAVPIKKENVGLSPQKQIKVYIPAEDLIFSSQPSPEHLRKEVDEIVNWHEKCQENEKRGQVGKKRLEKIDLQLESIRRKIKLVENKYQVDFVKGQNKKAKMEEEAKNEKEFDAQKNKFKHDKIQQNINCINIFHSTNQILNPNKHPIYYNQFDNESIDTYQMEMGDDYEMPNLKTNQRLRQTIFTDKKPWDTFTTRSPTKRANKIHESAGQRDFKRMIENNKKRFEEGPAKVEECETIQETIKNKNWRTETFRSESSPNIQERVQEALAKTKNVMQMLRSNKKSNSLDRF